MNKKKNMVIGVIVFVLVIGLVAFLALKNGDESSVDSSDKVTEQEQNEEKNSETQVTEVESFDVEETSTKDEEKVIKVDFDKIEPNKIDPDKAEKNDKPYADYQKYNSMTDEEQEDFFNSFENLNDFFAWYNKAKKEYEDRSIVIDSDSIIDFGE